MVYVSKDGVTEARGSFLNLDYYVPPDDRFSPIKFSEFITSAIQAVIHFVIPEVKSLFQGDINNFRYTTCMHAQSYSIFKERLIKINFSAISNQSVAALRIFSMTWFIYLLFYFSKELLKGSIPFWKSFLLFFLFKCNVV